jgi:hypothetical protein
MEEFKEKIINRVKNLKIKPKSYFMVRTIFSVLSILALFFLSLFLISLISFIFRINAFNHLHSFGWFGISLLFANLPWVLIFLSLIFIIGLYHLSKRYSLVYKKPVIYSLVITIVIVLFLGLAVNKTGIHASLSNKRVPFIRNLYEMKPRQINRGEILDIQGRIIILRDSRGEEHQVVISSSTAKISKFEKGDLILIVGKKHNHSINARGILSIPKRMK